MAIACDKLESELAMQKKRVRVSEKRQFTIPKAFYDALDLSSGEVECLYNEETNEIIIRKVRTSFEDFSELILEDLFAQGYRDEELIQKFKEVRANIRPTVESMITDAAEFPSRNPQIGIEQYKRIFFDPEKNDGE